MIKSNNWTKVKRSSTSYITLNECLWVSGGCYVRGLAKVWSLSRKNRIFLCLGNNFNPNLPLQQDRDNLINEFKEMPEYLNVQQRVISKGLLILHTSIFRCASISCFQVVTKSVSE